MRQLFKQSHPWIMQAIGGLIAVIAIIPVTVVVYLNVFNNPSPPQAVPPLAPPQSSPTPAAGAQTPSVTPTGSHGGGGSTGAATWTAVHSIFAQNCAPCHIGAATAGLNLDTYAGAMKGGSVAAGGVVNGPVIKPGNAAGSYLYQAISGKQTVGAPMPLGRPPLSAADQRVIFNWIQSGAKG